MDTVTKPQGLALLCLLLMVALLCLDVIGLVLFLWNVMMFCMGLVTYFGMIFAALGGLQELSEGVNRRMQHFLKQVQIKGDNALAELFLMLIMIPVYFILCGIMFPVFVFETLFTDCLVHFSWSAALVLLGFWLFGELAVDGVIYLGYVGSLGLCFMLGLAASKRKEQEEQYKLERQRSAEEEGARQPVPGTEAPEWDKTAAECALCQASFGVFRHRHWCRRCKRTICSSCCAGRIKRGYGAVNPDNACKACKKV